MKNFLLLSVILAMSCGAEVKELPLSDMGSDTTGDMGSDTSDMGTTLLPILQRSSKIVKKCTTDRAFGTLKNNKISVQNPYFTTLDSKLILARAESESVFSSNSNLLYGELSDDSALSEIKTVTKVKSWPVPILQVHSIAETTAAVVQKEEKNLHLFLYDKTGKKTLESEIVKSDKEIRGVRSVVGHEKIVILWQHSRGKVSLSVLNKDGDLDKGIEIFKTKKDHFILSAKIIVYDKGFKILAQEVDPDHHFKLRLLDLNKDGEKQGDDKVIYTSSDKVTENYGYEDSIDIVQHKDEFLVSWSEQKEGKKLDNFDIPHTRSTVKILKLDASGHSKGEVNILKKEVEDVDISDPSIVSFGDQIALFWSEGSYIYLCAGCFPDHRVSVVLLDPETLSPRSEVLKIDTGGGTSHGDRLGGLRGRQVIAKGEKLHIVSRTRYHVHDESAYGRIECK